MGIARSLNTKIFRPFNSKNADTAQHILNRKANAKLNYVASIFSDALNKHWEVIEDGFLYKRIALRELPYIDELKMSYYLQNRFFARTYDLRFEFRIPFLREEDAKFELSYTGITQISGAKFNLSVGGKDDLDLLIRLNSEMITDRLVKLDFLDFKIAFSVKDKGWVVSADSIIGSATWNLLPPMFQVIKPTFKECIQMIELFQLIMEALINSKELENNNPEIV
jgi:hypothetical protein